MDLIDFQISNSSFSPKLDLIRKNEVVLSYPCPSSDKCSSYNFVLPPGKYLLKAYGASSGNQISLALNPSRTECISANDSAKYGGNAVCRKGNYSGGSGGYISGVLTLFDPTKCFVRVGGSGKYLPSNSSGGFNGGGASCSNGRDYAASGGGATDFRIGEDDLYHRILVAGGGGGTDNVNGNGGAGGYPEGQGFWIMGEYNSTIATQTGGFSFGIGQSALSSEDVGGAGGGWFGGYASNNWYGGAGGGSSYALTKTSSIPELQDQKYAFDNNSPYTLDDINHANGIWEGNGKMHIILLRSFAIHTQDKPIFKSICFQNLLMFISLTSK